MNVNNAAIPIELMTDDQTLVGDAQLQIVVHQHPRAIQVGKYYFNFPDLLRYSENRCGRKDNILALNNRALVFPENINYKQASIWQHKKYAELFGPHFNNRFQKVSYSLWVGDDRKIIHRFCRTGRCLSDDLVFRFHQFRELIDQAVANQELQLIPAILYFGLNINELKQRLGNQIWRHLCNSTVSRNIAIFKLLGVLKRGEIVFQHSAHSLPTLTCVKPEFVKTVLAHLTGLPSGILNSRYVYTELSDSFQWVPEMWDLLCPGWEKQCPGSEMPKREDIFSAQLQMFNTIAATAIAQKKLTNNQFLKDANQLILDTRQLAQEMDESFNLDWSLTRIKREHKRLTKLLAAKRLQYVSKTPYVFSQAWERSLEWRGIVARLLLSPYDLALEGIEMNHCVAIYHGVVFRQKSIIFALKNADGYRSTLQLSFKSPKKLKINQHRTVNDDDVTNDDFLQAAQHVLRVQSDVLANTPIQRKSKSEGFFVLDFSKPA